MATVVLVIHLMIAAALVGSVLLQRSEGGALGIGGSGGGGGFMTGRGTANLLTRVTAGLAAMFFITSISLTILARQSSAPTSILEGTSQSGQSQGEGILDSLRQSHPQSQPPQPSGPAVPQSQ